MAITLCITLLIGMKTNAQYSYSKSRAQNWKANNNLERATIFVRNSYLSTMKVVLFHPDTGNKYRSWDVPGPSEGCLKNDNGRFTIGSDWGIMVIHNGRQSCVKLIGEVVKSGNGYFMVELDKVFN